MRLGPHQGLTPRSDGCALPDCPGTARCRTEGQSRGTWRPRPPAALHPLSPYSSTTNGTDHESIHVIPVALVPVSLDGPRLEYIQVPDRRRPSSDRFGRTFHQPSLACVRRRFRCSLCTRQHLRNRSAYRPVAGEAQTTADAPSRVPTMLRMRWVARHG